MNKNHHNFPFGIISIFLLGLFACTPQTAPVSPTIVTSLETEAATITPALSEEPAASPTTAAVTETPAATEIPLKPTIAPISTSTPEPVPTDPTPTPKIAYAVVGVASDDTLNVRQEAGVDNEVVGEIKYNGIGITLINEPIEVDNSAWVQIEHAGVVGWVNSNYLALQAGESNSGTDQAVTIIQSIEAKDFTAVAQFAHPSKGVRFSPYTYVRDTDIVFQKDELAQATTDPTVYTWGGFDGSGEPIDMTFADYYERFIYDAPFAWPHTIGFNQFIGWSNTLNNIEEYYPESQFIEYYFPGFDEELGGLDWRGLRLIFEEESGEWYLVGIVHTEWTI